MKKLLNVLVFLLVATLFATSASAAGNYVFEDIEVNGVDIGNEPIIYIERGENVDIRVELYQNFRDDSVPPNIPQYFDMGNVKVKAWIGGYEYGDIEYITNIFDMDKSIFLEWDPNNNNPIETHIKYVKNLVLKIPEDINPTEDYILHVEVYNKDNTLQKEIDLRINEQRHNLNFVDVIFNPGLSVRSDQPLFVTTRIENLGEKKEEDIRVSVSIPELGISQRSFINELTPTDNSDDEESSESTEALFLDLDNVKAGIYNLVVKAEYNRGHSSIEKTFQLTVKESKAVSQPRESFIVDVTEKVKDVEAGEGVVYKVSLANLGSEARTLTLEVAGVDAWGNARSDPSSITVEKDSSREAFVYINAKENAESGNKMFTVRVKDGNTVLKEVQLQANVKGNKITQLTGDTSKSLRTGLEIGFVILLIILVILGIVLAINKMKGKDDSEQTYY